MAAGTFVQGASIELSADGPCREPYNVYFQGGLTFEHGRIAIMSAAKNGRGEIKTQILYQLKADKRTFYCSSYLLFNYLRKQRQLYDII